MNAEFKLNADGLPELVKIFGEGLPFDDLNKKATNETVRIKETLKEYALASLQKVGAKGDFEFTPELHRQDVDDDYWVIIAKTTIDGKCFAFSHPFNGSMTSGERAVLEPFTITV